MTTGQIAWRGLVLGVQPRIDLMRSFDQRSHSYLGYVLAIDGSVGNAPRQFTVRIGSGTQEKHGIRAGDRLSGIAHAVADRERETADFYRASGLKFEARGVDPPSSGPPWLGAPPPLPVYRERGHRRLDARTYDAKCHTCRWGCRMAVEIIVDQWKPDRREHRFETFCYGPKSCPSYRPGPTRKVPGRKGMSWEEEDWVDEDAVAHRGPDE
jgi:hypothetical protein